MEDKEKMLTMTSILATHYKEKDGLTSYVELCKKKELKNLDKTFSIIEELLETVIMLEDRYKRLETNGKIYLTEELSSKIRGIKNSIDLLTNKCSNFKEI